jgi:transcriptional regulator with XRE-family HTH domain
MTLTTEALSSTVSDPTEREFLRKLGKRIRLLRVDREISQELLARAAGMSRNFVSSIERGAHGVDVVRLVRLAVALDVTLNELLPPIPKSVNSEPTARRTA